MSLFLLPSLTSVVDTISHLNIKNSVRRRTYYILFPVSPFRQQLYKIPSLSQNSHHPSEWTHDELGVVMMVVGMCGREIVLRWSCIKLKPFHSSMSLTENTEKRGFPFECCRIRTSPFPCIRPIASFTGFYATFQRESIPQLTK